VDSKNQEATSGKLLTSRTADPLSAGIERFVGLEHIEPENLQ